MPGELATCLRAWRRRLSPAEAGLPAGGARRTPGLRREEVAAQAGISVNYLTRLEQDRARAPSSSVTASLAAALRLNQTETAHLHLLAGHADHTARVAARHVTPSLLRLLERFEDVPAIVIDPAWTVVEANPMARALLAADLVGENAARRQFLGPQWVQRDLAESDRFERDIAADLHIQIARHPDDPALIALIRELRGSSARFAELWANPPAGRASSSRKTFHHRDVGTITLDCDQLEAVGSDLRLITWTAAPGSPDASALELLGVHRLTTMRRLGAERAGASRFRHPTAFRVRTLPPDCK